MDRRLIWQRLLGGILDGLVMSLFVVFSAFLTWVWGA